MNLSSIVFLKNKSSSEFEYKRNVLRVNQVNRGFRITFNNGKSYNYSHENVMYYPLLSTREDVRIYEKGKLSHHYNTVNNYGPYVIFRNNKYYSHPIENNNDIEISDVKRDINKTRSVIDYFKYILEKNGEVSFDIPSNDNNENDVKEDNNPNQISAEILLKALNSLDLQESRSALSNYIEVLNPPLSKSYKSFIFPFGCNESQKMAVETSLTNSISVIEGPPGTGKTQTILNIIANLIVQGKTVAIVSNNNSAVFNVKEKLEKYGYGRLVASLGNNKNKVEFFNTITEQESSPKHKLSREMLKNAKDEIRKLDALLTTSFQYRNKLATLKTDLSDAKIEFSHLKDEQPLDYKVKLEFDKKFYRKWDLNKIIKIQDILSLIKIDNKIRFKHKLKLVFQHGLLDFNSISRNSDEFDVYVNHKFYDLYITKTKDEIIKLTTWLDSHNEEDNLNKFIQTSQKIFDNTLFERYKDFDGPDFEKSNYLNEFDGFIKYYPVVLSSTLSLHTSIPKGYLFDFLIIDESSQVDIIKSSVCFSCCRNVVVVGDSMQLSHIVDDQSQNASEEFLLKYNVSSAYDYINHNILTSLKTLYGNNIQSVLLKEHYRCHPAIIGFCNKKYYNNKLVIMTNGENYPFKIIETSISGERNNYNQRQIDETDYYIRSNYSDDYSRVGVIAPYRNHADKLQKQLPENAEADTIHKFQGREKDVIIFNTVRGKINTFIDNPNLINVAVSRAVKEFVIVKPNSMEPIHGTNIGDLIRYINYTSNSKETMIKGNISSVFDLLYKEYNKDFEVFISSNQHIEGSAAEIIIYKLLRDKILLNNSQFSSINMVREYKLRDLIRNIEQFSADEAQFIRNNSRIDFLLYNKIDKTPVLAIEVDGVSFHDNQLQQERDKKKNNILNTIGLALLRLSTDGHNEEAKIVESLKTAMEGRK